MGRNRTSAVTAVLAGCLVGGTLTGSVVGEEPPLGDRAALEGQMQTDLQDAMHKHAEGDFDAAFIAFSELLKQHPAHPEVNFGLGMAALGANKLSHAALAFERVIALQPNNDRARLELARTYAAMGQFELADAYFREVLERAPPPTVRTNIERYLDQLGVAMRRWQVAAGAGAGFLYDDNVNVGPASTVVDIVPTQVGLSVFDELEVGDESRPKEDAGAFYSLSLAGLYDPGIRGRWMVQGGAAYYQTLLQEEKDFEVVYVRGYAGLRHSGPAQLFDGRLYADYLQRGGEDFAYIYGVTPAWIRAASDRLHWTTLGSVEYRDYADADDLDAAYVEAGQRATVFGGDGNGSLSMSLAGIYNRADEDAFTYAGARVELGVQTDVPLGCELDGRAGYRYSRYDEAEVLAAEPRRDHEVNLDLRLDRPVTDRISVSARYQHTRNHSSFDLYDYRRNVVTLSLDVSL